MATIADDRIDALQVMPPLLRAQLFRHVGPRIEDYREQDAELYEPLMALHKVLSTRFYYFDLDSHGTEFNFPETKFDSAAGEELVTSQQRPAVFEDTFKNQLTSDQKDQIARQGTFDVPSNMSKVPYRWRVHPWIVKGSENVTEDWYRDMARSYHQLRQVEKRLVGETLSLKLNFSEFKYYPVRIMNMLVGVRQMVTDESPNYERLLEMHFMLHKFRTFYSSEPHELNEQLKVPVFVDHRNHVQRMLQEDAQEAVNNKLNKLRSIDNQFDQDWAAVERQLTRKYRQETAAPNEKEFTEILRKEKQERYDNWLREKLPKDLQQNIFYLLRIFTIFQVLGQKLQSSKSEARERIEKDVREKHKIRSRDEYFWEEEVQRQYAPIEKALDSQYLAQLKDALKSKLFEQYMAFRDSFNRQLEKLQAKLPVTYRPRRTFYTSYRLFPPYEKRQDENGRWWLKKSEGMQCDTGHHFWKLSLYKMRLYSWTRNCFFWLVANSWVGPFGLRVIFSIEQFRVDQNIHYKTGQITYTYQLSLIQQFLKVMQGIRDSRNHFEGQPDTGFFGKNFSRIFNLIECYIFRFLIVGVIILLVLYPIAIVVNSVLSFVLAITSWLWTPLVAVVCYVFNVLVYQFEIDDIDRRNRYSERWFPLISTPLMFVLNIVRIIVYMIGAAIVHPVLAVLLAVLAVLRHLWSSATDFLLFQAIKLLARTPNRDTKIAWKISGPEMSRQYYDAISEQNIYILVQANLERSYLQQYYNQMMEKIKGPVRVFEETMRKAMSVFESTPRFNRSDNIIYLNQQEFENRFNKAYNKFCERFPRSNNLSRVRFTQEELDTYLDNCNRIIRNFIESRNCIWFFQQRGLEFGDYEELTKVILREIFSYEVLEPFEDLDSRFELKEASSSRSKQMIIKALKGEVQLNEFRPSTTRLYKTFRVGEIPINRAYSVVNAVSRMVSAEVSYTRGQWEQSMLINPHIEAIIAYDKGQKRYDSYTPELFA